MLPLLQILPPSHPPLRPTAPVPAASIPVAPKTPAGWTKLIVVFDPAHLPPLPPIARPQFADDFANGSLERIQVLAQYGDSLFYQHAYEGAARLCPSSSHTKDVPRLRQILVMNNIFSYLSKYYDLASLRAIPVSSNQKPHADLWEAYFGAVYLSSRSNPDNREFGHIVASLQPMHDFFDRFYTKAVWGSGIKAYYQAAMRGPAKPVATVPVRVVVAPKSKVRREALKPRTASSINATRVVRAKVAIQTSSSTQRYSLRNSEAKSSSSQIINLDNRQPGSWSNPINLGSWSNPISIVDDSITTPKKRIVKPSKSGRSSKIVRSASSGQGSRANPIEIDDSEDENEEDEEANVNTGVGDSGSNADGNDGPSNDQVGEAWAGDERLNLGCELHVGEAGGNTNEQTDGERVRKSQTARAAWAVWTVQTEAPNDQRIGEEVEEEIDDLHEGVDEVAWGFNDQNKDGTTATNDHLDDDMIDADHLHEEDLSDWESVNSDESCED